MEKPITLKEVQKLKKKPILKIEPPNEEQEQYDKTEIIKKAENWRAVYENVLKITLSRFRKIEEQCRLLDESDNINENKILFGSKSLDSGVKLASMINIAFARGVLDTGDEDSKFISDQEAKEHLLKLKAQEIEAVNLIRENIE